MSKSIKCNKNSVTVEFLGNNAEHVAGSCILVKYNNIKLLLDYGQQQGGDKFKDFIANKSLYKGIKVNEIDAIIISHLNVDHFTGIGTMVANNYCNPIFMPINSSSIARVLLSDTQYLNTNEARLFSKFKNKNYEPSFSISDVDKAINLITEISFNDSIRLSDYIPSLNGIDNEITLEYIPAGHIPLSSQIVLNFLDGANWKTIVYTGDINDSNNSSKLTLPIQKVECCNLLIGESTYCKKEFINPSINSNVNAFSKHKDVEITELLDTIKLTLNNDGSVLIPVFSMARAQEMLSLLYDNYRDCPYEIILDSPMMNKINNLYRTKLLTPNGNEYIRTILDWDKVRQVKSLNVSKMIIANNKPKIILASSGMLVNGTRSSYYAQSIIEDKRSTICFVGYNSPNTLGFNIQQKYNTNTKVKINDRLFNINCTVATFKAFSSHMQYNNLLEYYSSVNTPIVALVHGEMEHKKKFAKVLSDICHSKCKSTKVIAISKQEKIII